MSEARDVVTRAVNAAGRGYGKHADSILRHAVHGLGLRPVELILAALAAEPQSVQLAPSRHTGATMNVRYIGPSGTGVKVVHPDPETPGANTVTVCPPGETVDLPAAEATSLVDAGVFEPADKRAEAALRRNRAADAASEEPPPDADVAAAETSTEEGD